ncbi:MAG: sugar kinase [Eubacteriales bacterium]|nr:sugar kinase [Eubacteriales bacterium]
MTEIMTFGEPMVVYIAEEPGSFQEVSRYSRGLAGAELNFAVGVTRLGHQASYFSKLGDDPYGAYIRSFIEKEGIDGSSLVFDSRYLTGSYIKTKVYEGDPEVFYFRKNSAASHIGPEDVRSLEFKGTRLFHLTGITPALSKECKAASIEAVRKARWEKVMVMFDPNIREKLWDSKEEMRDTLNTLAFESDIFLPGIKEGRLLTGLYEPREIADYYLERGTGAVIIKLGAQGAYFRTNAENGVCTGCGSGKIKAGPSEGMVPGYKPEKIVDTVGAGDAFAAGAACALLEGLSLEEAAAAGNAMGAIIISAKGDNDNLPDKERLHDFMKHAHRI